MPYTHANPAVDHPGQTQLPAPGLAPELRVPTPPGYESLFPHLRYSALLAVAGGFLDGFTYVTRNHVFANAMSGNVVLLGINAIGGQWRPSLRHFLPIITFLVAIWAARSLHLPRVRERIRHPKSLVLLIEVLVLALLSCIPSAVADFWITVPISFIASMQVETFRTVNGQSFNTTFVTGNLRTLSENCFDWMLGLNLPVSRNIVHDFTTICTGFLLGATLGGFLGGRFGNRALWFDVLLLAFMLIGVRLQVLVRSGQEPISGSPEP
jgi:uncharacterized membrane protein YoaK (UPF0700 family)